MRLIEAGGLRIAALEAGGAKLDSEQAALDAIGEAHGVDFDLLAIPKERPAPDFLTLRTGLLGAVTQKFVNYSLRVAFIGDFSAEIAASGALRDYVRETNTRGQILFAATLEDAAALARHKAH
ncbi:MAG TPA: DUF4180 domain-containing protein [Alphaproteobacteria bacterium]|nr:DUF4180 domain-containing protein [Alphaproteobacteria bacterium]